MLPETMSYERYYCFLRRVLQPGQTIEDTQLEFVHHTYTDGRYVYKLEQFMNWEHGYPKWLQVMNILSRNWRQYKFEGEVRRGVVITGITNITEGSSTGIMIGHDDENREALKVYRTDIDHSTCTVRWTLIPISYSSGAEPRTTHDSKLIRGWRENQYFVVSSAGWCFTQFELKPVRNYFNDEQSLRGFWSPTVSLSRLVHANRLNVEFLFDSRRKSFIFFSGNPQRPEMQMGRITEYFIETKEHVVRRTFADVSIREWPLSRLQHNFCVDGRNVYLIGGYHASSLYPENGRIRDSHELNDVWVYNFDTRIWRELPFEPTVKLYASTSFVINNNELLICARTKLSVDVFPLKSKSLARLCIDQLRKTSPEMFDEVSAVGLSTERRRLQLFVQTSSNAEYKQQVCEEFLNRERADYRYQDGEYHYYCREAMSDWRRRRSGLRQ